MAVGKNKKMGKKGSKKKIIDPFTRKEWYDIKAPSMFTSRQVGKTFINKTQGTKIASEGLKGRVFEVSLGDLNKSESDFRKFRLICEDVQGRNVLTNFHGMSFTRDKLCSIVKKWHTLIQANVAVKTADGYVLRLFAIGFTKRAPRQIKKTSYAQSSQVRAIRAKMVEIIQKEVNGSTLKEVVNKLIPDSIGKDMEKACSTIFPLQDVYIRKVKILKKPKFEHGKLAEIHGDGGTFTTADGVVIEKPDSYEPPVQESV
uniref:Small ribosomal subunit protein eS1 n=1 Tax=Parastrongyloides trichosuri TaxID=131310 RepID=A0A0N4ZVB0_PARTI